MQYPRIFKFYKLKFKIYICNGRSSRVMSLPIWSKYGRIYSLNQHVARYREDFNCLLLIEREIGSFAKISEKFGFFRRGSDSAEAIEIDRILAKMKLTKTRFHSRIFSVFDAAESGFLSFHHLVLIVWNVCTIDILSLGENHTKS
jgi:hypothetical protein